MKNPQRRAALTAMTGLATATFAACAGAASSTDPVRGTKKTFVLVHGAFHGGWCWQVTADALRDQGHRVYTPTLTGAGDRSHLMSRDITLDMWVKDIVNLMKWEQLQDVVLVGHSFGGLTVAGVVDQVRDRVRHLILLDALLLENGKSAFDSRPAADVERAEKIAQETSGGLSVPAPPLTAFGLKDEAILAAVTPRLTPHPLSAYRSKFQLNQPLGQGVEKSYVVCSEPKFAPLESSRQIAQAAGFRMLELKTNHEAMLAQPRELAALLTQIS